MSADQAAETNIDVPLGDVPLGDVPLADRDLVLQFESIGDNCELGLVQRMAGGEPLGLLRFAGTPLRSLLRALNARFAGIADPGHIRVHEEHGEYMVKLTRYDSNYHANVKVSEIAAEVLQKQQSRTVRFLAEKLIADLETPSKILVFRQNEALSAADLVDLRTALSRYGPAILLWVQEARPGHPPGTVDVIDDRLLAGYVRRLASRENVPDLDYPSWMTVLRSAHMLVQVGMTACRAAVLARPRTEIIFGHEGNAQPHLGFGWSGPEAGYTWSIGERSLLILENPGPAKDYWLEMEVAPYVAPPLLPCQRLDILVAGTLVHSFDPLSRGEVGCLVPGRLIAGRTEIDIVLEHPHAASPILVAGGGDDRRLAISFTRVALVCG